MSASYSELLKDPRWQRKRLEILERDNWSCQECGDNKNTLHVHHRAYRKGAKPWEYDAATLVSLCETCHQEVTHWQSLLSKISGRLQIAELISLCGMAAAVLDAQEGTVYSPDPDTNFAAGYLLVRPRE